MNLIITVDIGESNLGKAMFAIGHFALGYLFGKGSSKVLNTQLNLPLLLAVSVLPDIDLVFQVFDQSLFMHRGPSHSIVTFTVLLIPFFLIFGKRVIPYYLVLLSHSLIGDIPTGGIEMLWPLSQSWFGSEIIAVGGLGDVIAEMVLFFAATPLMFRFGDLKKLVEPKISNWVLVISIGAILGPMFEITQGSDAALPLLLIPASLFWVALFSYSVIVDLRARGGSVSKEGVNVVSSKSLSSG